jgi:hypothetical protein
VYRRGPDLVDPVFCERVDAERKDRSKGEKKSKSTEKRNKATRCCNLRPRCAECALAAEITEKLGGRGCMTEEHWELAAAKLIELEKDPDAFRVIRKYVALLNADVATLLFESRNSEVSLYD